MKASAEPPPPVLSLMTWRTALVSKMAAARGMDKRVFRKLYDERVQLMRAQRDGSTNRKTIREEIDGGDQCTGSDSGIRGFHDALIGRTSSLWTK